MMYSSFLTIIVPSIIAFAVTAVGTRFLMGYLYGAGVVGEDRNKGKPTLLASSGGLAVSFGIIVGVLVYAFGATFVFVPVTQALSTLLAVALSITLISFIGFLDDINVKQQRVASTGRKDIRKGLKQWQKPLLTFVGALPLMAINAGVSSVEIPFVGLVHLGLLYPLIVIPLAVIFVSNAFNLLGGFDGLQPMTSLIASGGLFLYCLLYGGYIGTLVAALLFAAILAFLPFNLYRARILPGDSFTYAVGAGLVAVMVTGQAEAFGLIVFIPWIIEFFLHLRKRFHVNDLGVRQKDGTFKAPYGKKIYSLTHAVMNIKKATEQDVTLYISLFEALFVVLAFLLKFAGLL
jgi:UDP-N-acetylglucosamine--dolichyl-phosphate N-acetylglucosaminephosphotransferase